MYFYIPVKIYAEEHSVMNHRKELAALGKKAFLITGRHSSRENGSLRDVEKALASEGVAAAVFDEIEENPSVETVMKAREQGLSEGVDFVVGVGGGSPMDAAKAIALMIRNREADASFLYQKHADSQALPVAEVATTCGTGSEATPYAILTLHEKRTKASISHRIFPELAFLDPRYLRTASGKVLCDTAVDALGHLIESYINVNATDYSRMCVEKGLEIWSRSREIFLGQREAELSDYRNMLNASAMAGMAISHTGTSLPHGLSYYVTYEKGTPHGKAIGHFLPGYLREAGREEREFLLGKAGFRDVAELSCFYDTVCGRDVIPGDLAETAVAGLLDNPDKLKNCPFAVDRERLLRMF